MIQNTLQLSSNFGKTESVVCPKMDQKYRHRHTEELKLTFLIINVQINQNVAQR